MTNFDPEKDLNYQNITPDETFRKNLRYRVIEAITNPKESFMNKKLIFSLSGAIAVLVIALLASQTFLPDRTKVSARQGFGKLPNLTQPAGGMGGDMARPQSGGGNMSSAPAAEFSADSAESKVGLTIAPEGRYYYPPKYEYSFEGELPEMPAEMQVFRDRAIQSGRDVLGLIAKVTGIGSLRNAGNANLQNVSISLPNSPFQYSLDQSGRFYLWSTEQTNYREITRNEAPPDEELVNIARSFAESQGIDLSAFGEPYVDQSWQIWAAYDKSLRPDFYPAQVQVIFPENLEDKPVVNWGGQDDAGFSVNIDLGSKKVTSAGGRAKLNRDASLYPTKSQEEVRTDLSKGGINAPYYFAETFPADQDVNVYKVVLDKVRTAYLQHSKYIPGGSNENYYLPVYVFSGTLTDDQGNKQPHTILVAAIQGDFFERPDFGVPMPLEKSAEPAM